MYRRPSSHKTSLVRIFSACCVNNQTIGLLGSLHLVEISIMIYYKLIINISSMYFNTMLSHQLLPTILKPTRITASTITLIDNIFTNIESGCLESSIAKVICPVSDHLSILIHTDLRRSIKRVQSSYCATYFG